MENKARTGKIINFLGFKKDFFQFVPEFIGYLLSHSSDYQ